MVYAFNAQEDRPDRRSFKGIYRPKGDDMNNAKIYNRIAKSLAQLFSVAKLYNFEHSIVREKIKSVYGQISDFMTAEKQSVILAKSAGVFFINGEKI